MIKWMGVHLINSVRWTPAEEDNGLRVVLELLNSLNISNNIKRFNYEGEH